MREIKFRYRIQNRNTEDILMVNLTIQEVENQGFTPPVFKNWIDYEVLSRDQYTGLKDKNDKEIWEGDWFKSYWRVDPFIIIFLNGSFRGKYPKDDLEKGFHLDDYEAKNGEVIGNIYENSELLNE